MRLLMFLLSYGLVLLISFTVIILNPEISYILGDLLLISILALMPIYPSIKLSSILNKKIQKTNIYKLTNLEVLTGLIELLIPLCLSFFLFEYVDKKESDGYGRYHEISDEIPYFFTGLFFVVLFLEWIRRFKSGKDKFLVFRYIYVIIMVVAFMLSIWYIGLMFEPNVRNVH